MKKIVLFSIIILAACLIITCKSQPASTQSSASRTPNTQQPAASNTQSAASQNSSTQQNTGGANQSGTSQNTSSQQSGADANQSGASQNSSSQQSAGSANQSGSSQNSSSQQTAGSANQSGTSQNTGSGNYNRHPSGIILDGASTYTVQSGDTLNSIARRFYQDGSLYPLIMMVSSNVVDPDRIVPQQNLTIPDLRLNMNDPTARQSINRYFTEAARVEEDRGRRGTAELIRNHTR